jgi:hypothetical protein
MASECHREDGAEVEVEWIIRNAITSSWASGVSRSKMRMARHRQIQGLNRFSTSLSVIGLFSSCLLEGYSIHDRAVLRTVLLGRSPREINEVRHRVDIQIGHIDEHEKLVTFGMSLISLSAAEEKWVIVLPS